MHIHIAHVDIFILRNKKLLSYLTTLKLHLAFSVSPKSTNLQLKKPLAMHFEKTERLILRVQVYSLHAYTYVLVERGIKKVRLKGEGEKKDVDSQLVSTNKTIKLDPPPLFPLFPPPLARQ